MNKNSAQNDRLHLTKFEGFIRQIDRNTLTDKGLAVLRKAFPSFLDANPQNEEIGRAKQIYKTVVLETGPPRRFAGARLAGACHALAIILSPRTKTVTIVGLYSGSCSRILNHQRPGS